MRIGHIVVVAAALGTAAPAAAQTWHRVARDGDTVSYVDADSIRRSGNLVYGYYINLYSTPINGRVYASGIRSEFACSQNYFRTLEYTFYNRSGDTLRTEPSETIDERKVPGAGSINESVFQFVCRGTGGTRVSEPFDDAPNYWDVD